MESVKLNNLSQDFKTKQIKAIKEIVQLTLQGLAEAEKIKKVAQEKSKILKYDLYDLKDGRLDRILERHNLDKNCGAVSVISLSRCESSSSNLWYIEYEIVYKLNGETVKMKINNSVTKMHASGTYKLDNGEVKYL